MNNIEDDKSCVSTVAISDKLDDGEAEEDTFKRFFKFYTLYNPEEPLHLLPPNRKSKKTEIHIHEHGTFFGLIPPEDWKIEKLDFPKGLIVIRNPFTALGQRYWISRCVFDFPKAPSINNVTNLIPDSKESICDTKKIYKKLRWATFGYHHNWDTKVYSEDSKCDFPRDLSRLTEFIARTLGFKDFKPEASICNYYFTTSKLHGHQDTSEINKEAPLFSISFGQSAIFLIGGESKEVVPVSLILRSGHIVIMSSESRLSYHGIPKTFKVNEKPWTEDSDKWDKEISEFNDDEYFKNAKTVIDKWCDDEYLDTYIQETRINLNIRQVLLPGQYCL